MQVQKRLHEAACRPALEDLQRKLEAFDARKLNSWYAKPVKLSEVPDYVRIESPMDLSTMR